MGAGDGLATDDVLDLLTRLVDQSLVVVDAAGGGTARYGLPETLRQYARARLAASGEAEAVHRRHAACYLALAEQGEPALRGPHQGAWLDRLETEHDNLRQALGWFQARGQAEPGLRLGAALWPYWSARRFVAEGRDGCWRCWRCPGRRAARAPGRAALVGRRC